MARESQQNLCLDDDDDDYFSVSYNGLKNELIDMTRKDVTDRIV